MVMASELFARILIATMTVARITLNYQVSFLYNFSLEGKNKEPCEKVKGI